MTPLAALLELLARVGASDGSASVLVSEHELSQWPDAAVSAMKVLRLLTKARAASSAVCPGCEEECVMPVHVLPSTQGAPSVFIVCDKRSDTDRVAVSLDRLQQWQCSTDAVCGFIAASLGLRRNDQQSGSAGLWNIGIATGDKRSQLLCLQANDVLALVAGNNSVPLAELIEYHDGAYSLDGAGVCRLVDSATTADSRYTPSNAKREASKLETQKQYQTWQKAYRALKRKRPGMSDVWYSKQIEKTHNPKGRDADTIREHMKP